MSEVITDNLDLWSSALLTKSTAGRGSNGKLEAYGIKKLRELILELAVRGKLLPQDPNDEPASVLLERIAREKARLIKEGVIKNEKSLPPISNEEIPFDIPGGWIWQRLGEVGFTQTGGTPSKTNIEYFGNDIPFIKPGDIYPGYVDYDNEGLSNEGAKTLGRTAPAGSVLMVCIGTIGKCNIIERTCAFNQQINSITPYMEMSRYLLNALGSVYFQRTAWERSSSTTIAILNKGKWVDIVVPIPPLAEQHRIVAKVDELMALCDQLEQQQTHSIEAHQTLVETLLGILTRFESPQKLTEAWTRIAHHFDTLFTTEHSIDQLKQTILQLAVMGKLVPQNPNDEPASVLIKEIAVEKARLVGEGKIKRENHAADIATGGEPFDVPDRWAWSELSQLLSLVTDGDHQAPPQSEEGIPFLVIGNLNTGKINFDNCKYVPIDYYEKLDWGRKPIVGDLLYTVTGSFGISVPIETTEKFCVQRHVAILKATDSTPRRYLAMVLGSKFANDYAAAIATGTAQKTVPLTGLRRMPIPVAPEKEQRRIVAKVDELMAMCDALKARLADAQTTQIHLADTIVVQAVA